jgi:hypothetical protein
MRSGLDEDLCLHAHRRQNRLAVHHASSLKNIESKLTLSEEEPVCLILYGDSQKMMKGLEILHGEFSLEGRYGLLQKCCVGCSEDNVINVKQGGRERTHLQNNIKAKHEQQKLSKTDLSMWS